MSEARGPEPFDDGDPSRLVGAAGTVFRLFEAQPVMVVGLAGPPDFRVVAANAVARAAVGRPDVVGLPLHDAFAGIAGPDLARFAAQVYATGAPMVRRDLEVMVDGAERGDGFADYIFAPTLAVDGTVDGVVVTSLDATASVRERRAAARRTGEAERRAEHSRGVIDVLQRELLPAGIPVLPGVQIAASYLLADADTAAGGDWFDALVLPDGRVALIVGDVVGTGAAASATMGRLQTVLHERLASGDGLLEAIEATDRVARAVRGARAATVCVVVLEPENGTLTYCTAGHPPPLLLGGEQPRYLAATHSGPLGVRSRFTAATDLLPPGETILLHTDGILERPGRELPAATVEFAQVAAAIAADRGSSTERLPVERLAVGTLELLTRTSRHSDDVTLLAAQRVPAVPDLDITVTADPAALRELRGRLASWFAAAGVPEHDATRVQHAVGELATNAIEHAHPDSADPAAIAVTAALDARGRLRVRVTDDGRWRAPRPNPDRGLGLAMVAHLIDTLEFDRAEHGTTAVITHTLTRPARLLTSEDFAPSAAPRPVDPDPFLVLDQPSAPQPRVRVDGPVDTSTAPSLEEQLQRATVAGTRSLTLDLTGVTHLGSAGVDVLHRLAQQNTTHHTDLRLYAPAGSPAHAILDLVRLPHTTTDPDY